MANGFNIQSVAIEGFKGFTSPQTIDFEGRHVFLLGRRRQGQIQHRRGRSLGFVWVGITAL